MTDRASPEFSDLIAYALEAERATIRVALPAKVTSYDAATRTVTAQPLVRRPLEDAEGGLHYEEFPPIQNVPVVFPGAASLTLYFPLAAGDVVELVWQDYSMALWRATGVVSDSGDIHAHGPGYPVAIPFYRPGGAAGTEPDASLGIPGGLRFHFGNSAMGAGSQSDFVAMAQKVDARLTALESTMNSHVHLVPITGPAGSTPSAPTATPVTPGTSTASSNLKAD